MPQNISRVEIRIIAESGDEEEIILTGPRINSELRREPEDEIEMWGNDLNGRITRSWILESFTLEFTRIRHLVITEKPKANPLSGSTNVYGNVENVQRITSTRSSDEVED